MTTYKKEGDLRRNTPALPTLNSNVGFEAPSGFNSVASRVAEFGNTIQAFTNRISATADKRLDFASAASEMVLKTNIDNSMRSFAASSINMFNPKVGLPAFQKQADAYTSDLLDGAAGAYAEKLKAYAYHAKVVNEQPLNTQAIHQAHNEARMNFLASIENLSTDISQSINLIPFDDALTHHNNKSYKSINNAGISVPDSKDSPSIDSVKFNISQALNQIEVAGSSGIISPAQAISLKKKIVTQANDDMLYHKYNLAVENGVGDQFIQNYAKSKEGVRDAADFAKHLGQFKKIEQLNLAQHAISEKTARSFMSDNLKNLELGKPNNTFSDSLALNAPTLFPFYQTDKEISSLSGGIYTQLTAGTQPQALQTYNVLNEANKNPNLSEANRDINQRALDLALKNSNAYFADFNKDPQKFIRERGLLGSVAADTLINEKSGIVLSSGYELPRANEIDASVRIGELHGIPANQFPLLTKSEAQEFGAEILAAAPKDKVDMIQSIQRTYKDRASNVMQQLIKSGSVPREYGWFVTINPDSGELPDAVDAISNPNLKFDSEQKNAVAKRVGDAMSIASTRAHPDVSTGRRLLGYAFQGAYTQITGRERSAAATNTGLFNTPALFDPDATTPDLKLKALTESYIGISGYKTGELVQNIESTVNKLSNFYISYRGLSQDDALAKATRVISGQYQFVDYKDNVIRLPIDRINFNDVDLILRNSPDLINKINWQYPQIGDFRQPASRTNQINYFRDNIAKGHWATDPTDSGLMWVNANGMVNRMANGNPLFISFESMKKIPYVSRGTSFFSSPERLKGESYEQQKNRLSATRAVYEILHTNEADFNQAQMGTDNPDDIDFNKIPDSFNALERLAALPAAKTKEFVNYLIGNKQADIRKRNQQEDVLNNNRGK